MACINVGDIFVCVRVCGMSSHGNPCFFFWFACLKVCETQCVTPTFQHEQQNPRPKVHTQRTFTILNSLSPFSLAISIPAASRLLPSCLFSGWLSYTELRGTNANTTLKPCQLFCHKRTALESKTFFLKSYSQSIIA